MGILAAQDITSHINTNTLIHNAALDNVEACSYDMRIGTIFYEGQIINAAHARATEQIIIQPGAVISMYTEEELDLPPDICGTAFPLNSQSSAGLLVLNPGHVDPGFKGPLTVKALNVRRTPMAISRGMEIFTIIFEKLPHATTSPYQKNESRAKRERSFNATDVEISPRSLSHLITISEDAPFPTRHEVNEMIQRAPFTQEYQVKDLIRSHWATNVTMYAAIGALVASIALVALTIIQLYPKDTDNKPKPQEVTPKIGSGTSNQEPSNGKPPIKQESSPKIDPAKDRREPSIEKSRTNQGNAD